MLSVKDRTRLYARAAVVVRRTVFPFNIGLPKREAIGRAVVDMVLEELGFEQPPTVWKDPDTETIYNLSGVLRDRSGCRWVVSQWDMDGSEGPCPLLTLIDTMEEPMPVFDNRRITWVIQNWGPLTAEEPA